MENKPMKLEKKIEEILINIKKSYDKDDPTAWGWGYEAILAVIKERDNYVLGVGKYAKPHEVTNAYVEIGRSKTIAEIGKRMRDSLKKYG